MKNTTHSIIIKWNRAKEKLCEQEEQVKELLLKGSAKNKETENTIKEKLNVNRHGE